jgi:steroid delta-isomerase-like uncharacterized protein
VEFNNLIKERKMIKLHCVISLAVLLCFTFACQNKVEKAELEKFRTQAKLEEKNKALVMREGEILTKGDLDALKELLAPDYLFYRPSRSAKPASRDEVIEGQKALRKAFPDLSFNAQEIVPVGDKVIVRFVGRGTHKGEFAGIPATGTQIEFGGIVIIRVENGKIVEEKEENDMWGIMMQLGMEFKPKEAKK